MADAAILFAVEKLGNALINKLNFLIDVDKQVVWVKNELQNMRCFLKDAAEKQGKDERIRQWIREVREVAQDAEDAIEMFALKLETPVRKRDLVRKLVGFPAHVSHLHWVGKEIESIRARLHEIEQRRERYGIRNLGEVGMNSSSEMVQLRRRMAARFQRDKDVVGLNQDADLVLEKVVLNEERKGLSLAAVVGMGGIGKSTLARKIYNHPAVGARFEHRAWVVVSAEFEAEDIMKEIMQQLPFSLQDADEFEGEGEDELRGHAVLKELRRKHEVKLKEVESVKEKLRRQIMLQEMLRQRLEGKRYFIVLDDVWEHTHWEVLKVAFPDEQGKASRLLFTSRNEIFTKRHGYIHKMRVLNQDESWELLLKMAFVGREGVIRCPQELEDIGREILGKCDGLPLAITVAGGLLVNQEESKSGWERVLEQMRKYDSKTSEVGNNISAILELSYQNLPSHLKPCFLCLAFFKEDAVIRVRRLLHIWAALGFVEGEQVEDISMSYLDELINRNLVQQVKDTTVDGRVKYCNVHDLLRELSIKKAKEEIGFESLTSEAESSSSSSSSEPRHRAVRGTGKQLMQIDRSNHNKRVRSLFLNVEGPNEDAYFSAPSYWKSFELLRILDIEGSILCNFPSTLLALIGIRYLRLREEGDPTHVILPSWLDSLKNLEFLEIVGCRSVLFPDVTWKMDSLRHMYIDGVYTEVSEAMKKSSWDNLHTLKYIRSDQVFIPAQGLRKLGILVLQMTREEEEHLFRILVESAVQVLHLRFSNMARHVELPISKSLRHLTKLKLHGHMYLFPSADKFPRNITHLTLSKFGLVTNNVIQELGKLPNLLVLKLDYARFSINSFKVPHEGFHGLRVLHLRNMRSLKNIEIEDGGMPQLQQLQIFNCPKLQHGDSMIRPVEVIIVAKADSVAR